jgi:hypothetical protein
VSLIAANDAFGAPLISPLYFVFYTDFSPPEAAFIAPPSDEWITDLHSPIELEAFDRVSPILIDTSEIEINGVVYPLSEIITSVNSYGNEIYAIFQPVAYGISWVPSETVYVVLTICDEPDTCGPNCAEYHYIFKIEPISGCAVYPNPFTPTADGINDRVVFEYPRMHVSGATLKIFDLRNNLVFEREIGASSSIENSWGGENSSGEPLAPGLYLYIISNDKRIVCQGTIVLVR